MSEHNVLVVKFPDHSAAFEAFASLAPVRGVKAAAVVAREADGRLSVPEQSGGGSKGFWTGSLVGAFVGILAGPLGVLLGWSAGAIVGSSFDWKREADEEDGVSVLSERIEPGSNVLMVEAEESDHDTLDNLFSPLQGDVLRLTADEVDAEVTQANEQAKEAASAARKGAPGAPSAGLPRQGTQLGPSQQLTPGAGPECAEEVDVAASDAT